jgi:uncharacterized protein (TIGR03437 family)
MAFDSQDRLYVVQFFGDVYRVETDGTVKKLNWTSELQAGTPNPAFSNVISIDPSDNVYVLTVSKVNCCYYALYRFTPEGRGSPIIGLDFFSSIAYTVDALGGVWYIGGIVNQFEHVDPSVTPPQPPLSPAFSCCGYSGDEGPLIAAHFELESVGPVTNDASGNIYVLDAGNAVIRKISGIAATKTPTFPAVGVVNAVSLQGGAVAPGELISIFGSNFGTGGLQTNSAPDNYIPKSIGNIRVAFDAGSGGGFGAITAATPNQINVFVPYGVANSPSVTITVLVDEVASSAVTLPVAQTAFGLATVDGSGSGQGAIFNQDLSYNSKSNPAAAGSVVVLFGTGEGVTTPLLPDGALVLSTPYSKPNGDVAVNIGNQPADVLYAGAAPFLPAGVLQINARIPAGVTGDAAIVVTIGGIATSRKVTVAVK